MQRIDTSTAVGSLPTPDPLGSPGYFNHAPPGSGNTPTLVSSDWCNMVQEELVAIPLYAGLTLDKTNHGQVLAGILSLLDSAGVNGTGSIFGLILSNTPSALTTSVTISVGQCRDSTNSASIALSAPIGKLLTAVFAAGSGNGGRDNAGALANGQTWHVFLILNPTSGAVDGLFSQSPTAPTLPTGFTKFRRLGAVVLDAAATTIRAFKQVGDYFKYQLRSTDYAAQANGSGVAYLRQIAVPNGIKVEAEMYFQSTGTVSTTPAFLSGIFDPDFGVPPAFGPSTQWAQVRRSGLTDSGGTGVSYDTKIVRQFTDASRQVYTFSSDTGDIIALGVLGWRDERGKFY